MTTRLIGAFLLFGGVLLSTSGLEAQLPGGIVKHDRGQSVSPVYEGFFRTDDGRTFASFGYFNKNYQEEIDVPVGLDNRITPGPEDQGQPTHFLTRRNRGVFAFELPENVQDGQVKWVLSVRGDVMEIPVNLDPEYLITAFRADTGRHPGNVPPTVKFARDGAEGFGPPGTTATMSARVGEPLALDAWVTDDGLGSVGRPRLDVSWRKYRGPGAVTFGDPEPAVESDRARTTVTFDEPGEYTLYLRASDGSNSSFQCCWTNAYLRVTVTG